MGAPLYLCCVRRLPSPMSDYVESNIDIEEWLIRNEPATFTARVECDR